MGKKIVIKKELFEQVLENEDVRNINITKADTLIIMDAFMNNFMEQVKILKGKNTIELRGLGTFYVVKRKPRIAKNPKTMEKVKVPERYVLKFRPGQGMKKHFFNLKD